MHKVPFLLMWPHPVTPLPFCLELQRDAKFSFHTLCHKVWRWFRAHSPWNKIWVILLSLAKSKTLETFYNKAHAYCFGGSEQKMAVQSKKPGCQWRCTTVIWLYSSTCDYWVAILSQSFTKQKLQFPDLRKKGNSCSETKRLQRKSHPRYKELPYNDKT